MTREAFAGGLHEAAIEARAFARKFVVEPLPEQMRFRIALDSEGGDPRVGEEVLFADDKTTRCAAQLTLCDEPQVVDELWRAGRVPELLKLQVIGVTGGATVVEITCCGPFRRWEEVLAFRSGELPFMSSSPALPPHHEPGQKFSLSFRASCWTPDDVDLLRHHAREVRTLALFGRASDDEALARLPALPSLKTLALEASSLSGCGVSELLRFPQLWQLQIHLDRNESFRLPKLRTKLPALEMLDITEPPVRPWGFSALADRAPALNWLAFKSAGELFVDGDCPRKTQALSVRATRLIAGLGLPKGIGSLEAHLSEFTDRDLDRWLAPVRRISRLDLGGTPISDAFAETLPARFGLRALTLTDTHVSAAAVERIRRAHPELDLWPRPAPSRP